MMSRKDQEKSYHSSESTNLWKGRSVKYWPLPLNGHFRYPNWRYLYYILYKAYARARFQGIHTPQVVLLYMVQ
jgi:hypothetical protein